MSKELYGKKLYVVVRHTYQDDYGDYVALVGVYDDKAEAERIAGGFNDNSCDVHEVGLGFTYPAPDGFCYIGEHDNTIPLGGYVE